MKTNFLSDLTEDKIFPFREWEIFWGPHCGYADIRHLEHLKQRGIVEPENTLLWCPSAVEHRLLPGHRAILKKPDYLTVTCIVEGSQYVRTRGNFFLAEAGDLILFLPGYDLEFTTGPEGFCEKKALTFSGEMLSELIRRLHLDAQSVVISDGRDYFLDLHRKMMEAYRYSGSNPGAVSGLVLEILIFCSQAHLPNSLPQPLRKSLDLITSHPGADLSLSEIAAHASVAPSSLNQLFRQYLQCSVHQYIIRIRMELAKQLLSSGKYSIKEVAEAVGYSTRFNFSAAFRHYFGFAPGTLLKKNDTPA